MAQPGLEETTKGWAINNFPVSSALIANRNGGMMEWWNNGMMK